MTELLMPLMALRTNCDYVTFQQVRLIRLMRRVTDRAASLASLERVNASRACYVLLHLRMTGEANCAFIIVLDERRLI